jgi:hypothetical protein
MGIVLYARPWKATSMYQCDSFKMLLNILKQPNTYD